MSKTRTPGTGWPHGISLMLALTLMVLLTLFPRGLTAADGTLISHSVLMLIMWGLSAGFVHGVGFVPHNPVLRMLLGPAIAWLLMGMGLAFYIRHLLH